MCTSKPKAPKAEDTKPDVLVTARDGQQVGSSASTRRKAGLRVDMNNSAFYSGLTIPSG